VQKRTVTLSVKQSLDKTLPKVGDPVTLLVTATPSQLPLADVTPTGKIHVVIAPGNVADSPALSPQGLGPASVATLSVTPPAGLRNLSAQYDGDSVFLAAAPLDAGTVNVAKGSVGFTVSLGKATYTVGEQITLVARITHPKVIGATPTGQITRASGPSQFQGATVGPDPQNSGIINVNLPVTGFPPPGNSTVTMTYSGDTNFVAASAGAVLTITKAVPQISLIPPAQVLAGQEATFVLRVSGQANFASPPPVSGQVTLLGVANGSTGNIVAGSSVVTLRQTIPKAGTYSISVHYAGDANYQAITTAPIQVVVQ
jgi:hypothetical protein